MTEFEESRTGAHFSRQAEAYARSPGHAADADLDILVDFAQPEPLDLCLDVATGPGHTAFRLAERAGLVVGLDIAQGMLATARRLAAERGFENLLFRKGDAAALPFRAASFDLLTCRIAPHHFEDVPGFLAEAARVLRPGGRLVVEDSLAPDDPEAAAFLHGLEVRRDPTHKRSLTRREWLEGAAAAGLRPVAETVFRKRHPFAAWLTRAGVPEAEVPAISSELLEAAPELRARFLEVAEGRILALTDEKLIFRADKPAPDSPAPSSARLP